MKTESFTNYRFINQKTGNIIYYLSINNVEFDHKTQLNSKKQSLADEKKITYEDIYYEEYH